MRGVEKSSTLPLCSLFALFMDECEAAPGGEEPDFATKTFPGRGWCRQKSLLLHLFQINITTKSQLPKDSNTEFRKIEVIQPK